MKWMVFFLLLILAGAAYAEVESVSSGVFRGSLKYIVTVGEEETVSNVAAGDFLAFRYADGQYLTKTDAEDVEVYVRRYDSQKDVAVLDIEQEKFLELGLGEELLVDVDADGVDDVRVTLAALDRRGTFTVTDVNAELACDIACFSDSDCVVGACTFAGTCDATCEVDERPSADDRIVVPQEYYEEETDAAESSLPPAPEFEDYIEPEEQPGFFSRVLAWFARLF